MPFNNDEKWNCDSKGKYDDETKVILKILFKKLWTMLSNKKKIVMEWMSTPPPPPQPIVVNNIIYLLCGKLGWLENK